MKKILIGLTLLMAVASAAVASPAVGQIVTLRVDSTRYVPALITLVNSGDNVNMVGLIDTDTDWPIGPPVTHPAWWYGAVDKGTGILQWQDNTAGVGPTGATGATGATGSTGATGPGSLVTSSSAPSLALNGSAIQFDSAHDTIYTISIKIATALSLTGGAAGHVDLICDASATPTTIVETISSESTGTLTLGLNLASSATLVMRWRVPAGDRCKATTTNDTGTPVFTLVRQRLQTLG